MFLSIFLGYLWSQCLGIFGGRITLHMGLCHKQFKMPIWFETFWLFATTILFINTPIGWIASHRMHHDNTDTDKDPHSPRHVGFLKVLTTTWSIDSIPRKYCKDLFRNKRIMFLHKYWKHVGISIWIVSLIISPYFLLGFCVMPFILSRVAYGLLNTVGHMKDGGSNYRWLDLFTVGEGFHLQHHINSSQIVLHDKDYVGHLTKKMFT